MVFYIENIIEEKELTLSENGSFDTTFDFKNLNPRSYTYRIYVGDELLKENWIYVAQFEKPKHVVDLSINKEKMFVDE